MTEATVESVPARLGATRAGAILWGVTEPAFPVSDQHASPWQLVVLGVALAMLVGFGVRLVSIDSPLGHDEAVYAMGGDSLVTGERGEQYSIYRPVGMRLLAAPGALAGGSEEAFRAFSIAWSVACLIAFWLAGRRLVGGAAGWTVLALVTSLQLQRRSAELLSDLPSLVFVFLLVWFVVGELEREGGPRRRLLAAAPLAAAAFYVRYGSALILAGVGVATLVVWWRPLLAARRRVAAAVVLLAALLIPHFVHSQVATGSPLGILRAGHRAAARDYFGEGLAFYARTFPERPGGLVVAALLVVGLVAGGVHLVRLLRRREQASRLDRAIAFAFLAAVLHTVIVGIDVHGEPRFIFFGMMLLALIGVHAIGTWAVRIPRVRLAAVVAALFLVAAGFRTNGRVVEEVARRGVGREATLATARVLREQGGGSCAVMSTEAAFLTWYSGCDGYAMSRGPERVIRRMRRDGHAALFAVVFDGGARDPRGPDLARLLAEVEQPPVAVVGDGEAALGTARVYRVRSAEPNRSVEPTRSRPRPRRP
jgi:4-amino-4-deoxy-L-arabinose transferase-like glycosyltransferase